MKRAEKGSDTVEFPIQSAKSLLDRPDRHALVDEIRRYVGLPPDQWSALYEAMFHHFAELVQELPASEYHHHARRGGLLDHSLEVSLYAIKLWQAKVTGATDCTLLGGAPPELTVYGLASAALLHDAGKVLADQRVTVINRRGATRWAPWQGPMRGRCYRLQFNAERRYPAHQALGLPLAPTILPAAGMAWLATSPGVLAEWTAAVGHAEADGPFAPIIKAADRQSVAQDLKTGDSTAPVRREPLEKRLLAGLRSLLQQEALALNRPGAVGWVAPDRLWLVAKTAVDALRDHLEALGQTDVPQQNGRLFDVLQQHHILITNEERAIWRCEINDPSGWSQELSMLAMPLNQIWSDDESVPPVYAGAVTPKAAEAEEPARQPPSRGKRGKRRKKRNTSAAAGARPSSPSPVTHVAGLGERFRDWVRAGVAGGALTVNETTAKVHVVNGGVLLVSPGIFRDFVGEVGAAALAECRQMAGYEHLEDWEIVQKGFQKLGIHIKAPNGQNIWTCRVKSAKGRAMLRGYWSTGTEWLWPSGHAPPDNPHLLL